MTRDRLASILVYLGAILGAWVLWFIEKLWK